METGRPENGLALTNDLPTLLDFGPSPAPTLSSASRYIRLIDNLSISIPWSMNYGWTKTVRLEIYVSLNIEWFDRKNYLLLLIVFCNYRFSGSKNSKSLICLSKYLPHSFYIYLARCLRWDLNNFFTMFYLAEYEFSSAEKHNIKTFLFVASECQISEALLVYGRKSMKISDVWNK